MARAARTVLVLHGHSQNGNIFSKRLGALRKQCGKDVEFVFVDAPHILEPADVFGFAEPEAVISNDPNLTPRAWWKPNVERTRAVGLEESLVVLRDVLKERRFDGVFGFSQGAAMAAVLAALLERPNLYPPFLVDAKPPHPPLQFCIAVSGFRVMDPLATKVFMAGYATPTLHVLGRTDVIVSEERSKGLIGVCGGRVEYHDGGHYVPSKGNWRKFLAEYMRDPLGDVGSPSASLLNLGSSTPDSGTATPTTGLDEAVVVATTKL